MKTNVVYMSKTGNTEKLAKEIFNTIPGKDKDIREFEVNHQSSEGDIYFVGFWVNRGTCSMDLLEYLSGLHQKKIAIFGTCGMGSDEAYYKRIEDNIQVWLPEDCEYAGAFLCQGKMPMSVRDKYTEMLGSGKDERQIQQMIQNFDQGMTHPDKQDLSRMREFVQQVLA
ncbi:MAG: flavodoxin family protein [Lachnospiraceae bacterium]